MSGSERDVVAHEIFLARRIGRLFRYEEAAATRRPDQMNRLRARRGGLIEALMKADATRRHLKMPITPPLRDAMRTLWRDIDAARRDVDTRLDWLRTELQLTRGEGMPTGIRGSAPGRVLGRG